MSAPPSINSATLPTTGDVIDGKYVLERLLGQGGMGAVYAARHRKLGHAVAIKVMLADAANHEAASRFVNEGRAAANIQNEHVVRVSDVDEENGYAYMVLELLEGEDLSQVLERERRLPPNIAVSYVCQALDGVRQAHAQGIVHRDLKPSNLFLAKRQDGSTVIKVLDFGISKANSSNPLGAAPGALTSTKAMLGSPLYMSPEQLRSSKSVDARADIWAIGVILYELITGKLPFMGDNLGELFAQILEVEAPLLRTHVPEAPQGVEAIVARCLQRKPEHRFQNVAELERELAPYAMGGAASPYQTHAMSPNAHTAMMATPPLAGVHAAQAAARASGQYGQPAMAQTPQGMAHGQVPLQGPPPGTYPGPVRGATTGSGAHAPVVKGTAPIGATTPQPYQQHQQTDPSWQNTGSTTRGSSTLLIAGACVAFLALIGLGVVGYSYSKPKPHDPPLAGSASTGTASVASAEVPPIAPASAAVSAPVAVPEPVASAAADAGTVAVVASAASAKPPVVPGGGHRPNPPPPVVVVKQPDPPPARPDPPPPVHTAPKPPPPSAPTGPLQNGR